MDWLERQYFGVSLAGIGLVVIGLLAGVLTMLVFDRSGQASHTEFRLVEQVDMYEAGRDSIGEPGPLQLNEAFKRVADKVIPSVASIQAPATWMEFPFEWFQRQDDLDQRGRSMPDIPHEGVGSGVVISPQGYIVTNLHVVDSAARLRVVFSDKTEYEAEVVGVDASTDLAVLKIQVPDGVEIPVLALADSEMVVAGEWVMAVGNPFRLTSTVTAGIVSATGRSVNVLDGSFTVEDFIQTDAAINPGNSGGALVNLRGELVGINTAIATESGSYEGYGFAIPASLVKRIAQDLIAYGEVKRGYMGVALGSVDADRAHSLNLEAIRGVYLESVEIGGPAYRGGLREGDVILSVGGRSVDAINVLQSVIAQYRPGEMVEMGIWRKGMLSSVRVELMDRDDPAIGEWLASHGEVPMRTDSGLPEGYEKTMAAWGLLLRNMAPWELEDYGSIMGVYVADIALRSASEEAGVPWGVVLERIGGIVVTSVEHAVTLLRDASGIGEPVTFVVRRSSGLTTIIQVEPTVE